MARLINADDFLKRLNERPVDYLDPGCDFYYLEETVESVLAESPTVDAVPVVRCKDCKRFVESKSAFVTYCSKGNGMAWVRPDDFCQHAERRSNG